MPLMRRVISTVLSLLEISNNIAKTTNGSDCSFALNDFWTVDIYSNDPLYKV